jgi:hypothetical protein
MVDDIQLSMLDLDEREGEVMTLSVDDETLTPNDEMAPGEPSAKFYTDIQLRGAIYPIIVVPMPEGSKWAFEVKDGRRRLRAYRRLFAAGLPRFATIKALVYTTYSEEDAETWGSNVNHLRSQNKASDLESIQAVVERYPEADPDTKTGRRFISQKTGIPLSTLIKLLKMLDMPQVFIQGAKENVTGDKHKNRLKVPQGALELIAGLGDQAQKNLVTKLKTNGAITIADVKHEKANETASRVADMQHLPGFGDLPTMDFSDYGKIEPIVDISTEWITIADPSSGEIVSWSYEDWTRDPALVFTIADTIKYGYVNGTEALRQKVGGNGNGTEGPPWDESEDHSGESDPG